MARRIGAFILAVVVFTLLAAPSTASVNQGYERKIVRFSRSLDTQSQEALIREFGFSLKRLPIINSAVILVPPEIELDLLKKPGVLWVEDDARVSVTSLPLITQQEEVIPWGVDRIDADIAWSKSNAESVRVAIIDSGIDLKHPDLIANIKGYYNTINPKQKADDDYGHGTHVAGIVAAAKNGSGVIGVGPKAELFAVKVINKDGVGYISDVIEGLQWCIANHMQVANMSFETRSFSQALHDAVKASYNAGLIMVASAGNNGLGTSSTVGYPAKFEEVIAVAAIDEHDAITAWSSRGPEVDIAAPGHGIYSTYKDSSYTSLSGTSMAAPHVTGAIALKLQLIPGLTPPQVMDLLKRTAKHIPNATPQEQGAGLVDALALVNAKYSYK
ncbi:MAG: S8 family peptidase [Actinomycetota bacterium]|nr:S8 family peptidase [Actinomycetota bacterium]